jgi:hypothetical protein
MVGNNVQPQFAAGIVRRSRPAHDGWSGTSDRVNWSSRPCRRRHHHERAGRRQRFEERGEVLDSEH